MSTENWFFEKELAREVRELRQMGIPCPSFKRHYRDSDLEDLLEKEEVERISTVEKVTWDEI